jgi:hypothetical protein
VDKISKDTTAHHYHLHGTKDFLKISPLPPPTTHDFLQAFNFPGFSLTFFLARKSATLMALQ